MKLLDSYSGTYDIYNGGTPILVNIGAGPIVSYGNGLGAQEIRLVVEISTLNSASSNITFETCLSSSTTAPTRRLFDQETRVSGNTKISWASKKVPLGPSSGSPTPLDVVRLHVGSDDINDTSVTVNVWIYQISGWDANSRINVGEWLDQAVTLSAGNKPQTDTVTIEGTDATDVLDDYVVDPYKWYVDGTNGNDNNAGHIKGDAVATINKAIDLASSGDTIIILPGTYDEVINLNSEGDNKSLTLQGTDMYGCKIGGTAQYQVDLGPKCILKNLSVITTNVGGAAIRCQVGLGAHDVVIENVYAEGANNAIQMRDADRSVVRNCVCKGSHNVLMARNSGGKDASGILVEHCVVEVVDNDGGAYARGMYVGGAGEVSHCVVVVYSNQETANNMWGLVFDGESFAVSDVAVVVTQDNANATGDVEGVVYSTSPTPSTHVGLALSNVSITTFQDGSGSEKSISAVNGTVKTIGCNYDSTKTSGDITAIKFDGGDVKATLDGELVKLAADGLSALSKTEPTGDPSTWTFQDWLNWLARRFANKAILTLPPGGEGTLKVRNDADSGDLSSQDVDETGTLKAACVMITCLLLPLGVLSPTHGIIIASP